MILPWHWLSNHSLMVQAALGVAFADQPPRRSGRLAGGGGGGGEVPAARGEEVPADAAADAGRDGDLRVVESVGLPAPDAGDDDPDDEGFVPNIPGFGDGYHDAGEDRGDDEEEGGAPARGRMTGTQLGASLLHTRGSTQEEQQLERKVYREWSKTKSSIIATWNVLKQTAVGRRFMKLIGSPKPAMRFLIFKYQDNIAEVVDENGDISAPGDEKYGRLGFNLIGTAPYKMGGMKVKEDSLVGMFQFFRGKSIPTGGMSAYDLIYVVPFEGDVTSASEIKWDKYQAEAAKKGKKEALEKARKEVRAGGINKRGWGRLEFLVWKVSEKCLEDAKKNREASSSLWTEYLDKGEKKYKPVCTETHGERVDMTGLKEKTSRAIKAGYEWQSKKSKYGPFTGAKSKPSSPRGMKAGDWPVGKQRLVNNFWVESVEPTLERQFGKSN